MRATLESGILNMVPCLVSRLLLNLCGMCNLTTTPTASKPAMKECFQPLPPPRPLEPQLTHSSPITTAVDLSTPPSLLPCPSLLIASSRLDPDTSVPVALDHSPPSAPAAGGRRLRSARRDRGEIEGEDEVDVHTEGGVGG